MSAGFGPLVSAAWLAAHRRDVTVVDVRWSVAGGPARTDYEAGHIPGAVFADLDVDLSAPASPTAGRHPLPAPDRFAAAMARLGVGDGDRVVAYDDAGGIIAARLWWMLDALGEQVAVLDGGIAAWDGPLETGAVEPAPARFTPRPWPADRVVDADGVAGAADGVTVLDGRAADRYRHGADIDPRPGHVPGAHSAPATDHLAGGRWRPATELYELHAGLGATGDVIAYCGSGVTACALLLGRRLAGLPDGRLYPGSWSQWGADPTRPATEGDRP